MESCILVLNAGSSSIKFALYEMAETLKPLLYGEIEGINTEKPIFNFTDAVTKQKDSVGVEAFVRKDMPGFLLDWLEKQAGFGSVRAIGYRIVYGRHTEPVPVTPELLRELKDLIAYAPEHLPGAIKLMEEVGKRYPALVQIACFDSSFHASMPDVAKLLPIPRPFRARGVQRYGFHGLAYAYLLEELGRIAGSETARGRLILAHLGNGASMAAAKEGKSVDTSMGFTPASGLLMGTRTGDLDPGVAWYMMQVEQMSPEQFGHLINHESGLLGISETSADMRELLQSQTTDHRAAEAVELFCYQAKKWIGSFAAVLSGLDTLIFSGGIGEHAPEVRKQICSGLQFLGIELEEHRNINNEAIISTDKSKVCVRVMQANEELMIAQLVERILNARL